MTHVALQGQGASGEGRGTAENDRLPLAPRPSPLQIDIPADFVLALIGYAQDNTLFKHAGVELSGESQAPIFDEQTMETNVPGIYVAGTAVAGTQDRFRVFIENCHVHVDRILAAITGARAPVPAREYVEPET